MYSCFPRCTYALVIGKIHSKTLLNLRSVLSCAFSANSCINYNCSHVEPMDVLNGALVLEGQGLGIEQLGTQKPWHVQMAFGEVANSVQAGEEQNEELHKTE